MHKLRHKCYCEPEVAEIRQLYQVGQRHFRLTHLRQNVNKQFAKVVFDWIYCV